MAREVVPGEARLNAMAYGLELGVGMALTDVGRSSNPRRFLAPWPLPRSHLKFGKRRVRLKSRTEKKSRIMMTKLRLSNGRIRNGDEGESRGVSGLSLGRTAARGLG